MPKVERRQLLSRARNTEMRAAEILRILHESPPGLGEMAFRSRVYDRLVARRAMDLDIMYDMMEHEGRIVKRPSYSGMVLINCALTLLLAMGLARKLKPGLYAITELGREEAEAWFPELRPPTDGQRIPAKASGG